jgi:hypothetical protein
MIEPVVVETFPFKTTFSFSFSRKITPARMGFIEPEKITYENEDYAGQQIVNQAVWDSWHRKDFYFLEWSCETLLGSIRLNTHKHWRAYGSVPGNPYVDNQGDIDLDVSIVELDTIVGEITSPEIVDTQIEFASNALASLSDLFQDVFSRSNVRVLASFPKTFVSAVNTSSRSDYQRIVNNLIACGFMDPEGEPILQDKNNKLRNEQILIDKTARQQQEKWEIAEQRAREQRENDPRK